MKIDERIEQLIAEELNVPLEKVVDDADFIRDLGASMDVLELFMRCEEEFGIEVPDSAEIYTVGVLKSYVRETLKDQAFLPRGIKL